MTVTVSVSDCMRASDSDCVNVSDCMSVGDSDSQSVSDLSLIHI